MLASGSSRTMLGLQHAVVGFALVLVALGQDVDPVQDRCARWHHSAMLRRDSIFIDGGVQLFRSNQTKWLGFSKYIYEIDVGRSWDVTTNFTESRIGRYADTSASANPPNMVRGALWAAMSETNRLFTFGGSTFLANTTDPDWQAPSQDPTAMWSYDTEIRNWQSYNTSGAVPWRPNWGGYAEDIYNDVGFFLNGQYDRGSSYGLYTSVEYQAGAATNASHDQIQYLGGLVMVDLHTQETWNLSTDSLGPPRVGGALLYAPTFGKSKNGTLMALGGMRSSGGAVDTFSNGALVDFSSVSMCDSFRDANVTWYSQPTTGDIPSPRIDFCALPFEKDAKDNSSYNFYIHGGYNPHTSTLFDDVYILSLPSFTWTKAYEGTKGRFGHTCNAAGQRYMMVTGGALDASLYAVETTDNVSNLNDTTCDDGLGISVFDLTDLTWGTFFNYNAPAYQVPRNVVDAIGGSGDGGATATEPVGGFAHPAIWTMFHPPPTPTASTASGTNNALSSGGIAGAVIGSIAGATLIVGAITWFALQKTRKARLRRRSTDTSVISELAGQSTAVHEKPALETPKPINSEPQELEAADPIRHELPTIVKDWKAMQESDQNLRQSKFAEETREEDNRNKH